MKKIILMLSVAFFAMVSCNKSEESPVAGKILSVEGVEDGSTLYVGDKVTLSVTVKDPTTTQIRWELDGQLISEKSEAEFTANEVGVNIIKLTVTSEGISDEKSFSITVLNKNVNVNKWISEVIEYRPAPGQFINTGFSSEEGQKSIVGKRGNGVSLGGFGGYIVFRFNHNVENQEGVDFLIHGNAMDNGSEPGGVMVSYDENGNGKADDVWYELKGSEYDKSVKNYEITYSKPSQTAKAEDVPWTDNKGATGSILKNEFNKQCYFPLFLSGDPSTLKFAGTLAPENATNTPGDHGEEFWTQVPLKSGYADNYSEDYPKRIGTDTDTERSNKFDIANAIDKDGKSVILKRITFIKVYTAIRQNCGWIGETSTEVLGAISLSAK